MQIEARGVVYDASQQPVQKRVAFFSGLTPLRSGTWLCGYTVGAAKHALDGTIAFSRSRDGGNRWQPVPWQFETRIDGVPGSIAAAEAVEVEPGRLLLTTSWFDRSDPTRPLFDPITEGILHSKQLVAESTDEGETWSPWRSVTAGELTGRATTGPLVRWSESSVAIAFESFKEFDDPRPGRHAAWLLPSTDGGRTFGAPHLVAQHPKHQVYYWDQRVVPLPGGGYVALFWTHHLEQKRDLNVHFVRGSLGNPPEARATPRDTGIPGQIAAPLVLDGPEGKERILAFVVNRDRPGTLALWQSRDGGATWPAGETLVVHQQDEHGRVTQGRENIDFAQYWEDMGKWSFGHPAIQRYDDSRVLVAWYAGEPGCLSVHWARIRV